MNNLLIGGSDLYDWSQVKTWAHSARDAGYDGDIVIIAYRIKGQDEYLEEARKLNVDVYQIDYDQYGQKINHNDRGRDTQSHQLRFFHMWQYLMENDHYDQVITTDIRDVYFQRNPFESPFLHDISNFSMSCGILASSEGIRYKNEPWGMDNMLRGFGPIVSEYAKEWEIYNVGVMAGRMNHMRDMFFKIYNMTIGRYIPSDQSAYNIFVNMTDRDKFWPVDHDAGWACQCGTTLDPEKHHYLETLVSGRPVIDLDNRVWTTDEKEYDIIHQWDRVPSLKEHIGGLY